MSLHYKKALETDIPVIYELAEKIWNIHYLPIIGQTQIDYMLGKMYSAKGQLEQMKNGQDFYLVHENEQAIGYFSIAKTDNEYMLHKLYILNDKQGKGLGAEVLSYIETLCKDGKSIKLTVNRKNFKTINFYFKHGFVIVTVEDFDIGDGYFMNDYVMVKKLS